MTFRLERIALSGHSYALMAPGQCNKAPRGRQRDAGACCIRCPASSWCWILPSSHSEGIVWNLKKQSFYA